MKYHQLKVWPQFFRPLVDGAKTFEFRRDDRGFEVGDVLVLREYDPDSETYSGAEVERTISYVMRNRPSMDPFDGTRGQTTPLANGFCILGLADPMAASIGRVLTAERTHALTKEIAVLEARIVELEREKQHERAKRLSALAALDAASPVPVPPPPLPVSAGFDPKTFVGLRAPGSISGGIH